MKVFKKIFLFLLFTLLFCPVVFADNIENPDIGSPSALLMDMSSNKVLYEKNIYEKMYPASLTKIMTAILTLENCNLSDIATVSENAVMSLPSRICNS